jgi:hypothetical protein
LSDATNARQKINPQRADEGVDFVCLVCGFTRHCGAKVLESAPRPVIPYLFLLCKSVLFDQPWPTRRNDAKIPASASFVGSGREDLFDGVLFMHVFLLAGLQIVVALHQTNRNSLACDNPPQMAVRHGQTFRSGHDSRPALVNSSLGCQARHLPSDDNKISPSVKRYLTFFGKTVQWLCAAPERKH